MYFPSIAQGSKIGLHVQMPTGLDIVERLLSGGAILPVFKSVAFANLLGEAKRISPKTLTLYRPDQDSSLFQIFSDEPDIPPDYFKATARTLVDSALQQAGPHLDKIDLVEICNEPDPEKPWGYTHLARQMIACMEYAERFHVRLGLFALNAGTPTYPEMLALVETGVFRVAKNGGHALTLHEGVFHAADIDYLFGQVLPGADYLPQAGLLCCLYRYLYALLFRRNEVVPLVISEFYGGGEHISIEDMARRVKWYDAQVRQDYYVLGFCPFTIGPTSAPIWTDYTPVYESELIQHAIAIATEKNAMPPLLQLPESFEVVLSPGETMDVYLAPGGIKARRISGGDKGYRMNVHEFSPGGWMRVYPGPRQRGKPLWIRY